MKYYKYLDIEYKEFSKKLGLYVRENKNKFNSFWTHLNTPLILEQIPETQKMFDPLHITVRHISIIITYNTNVIEGIHKDYTDVDLRINVPIINCQGSTTNFYQTNTEPEVRMLDNGIPYYIYDYKDCKLVDSFCLDRPAILRVRELHQVIANKNKLPRISCTIEFKEDISHLMED